MRVYWGALLSTLLCCFPGEKVGFKGDLKQMLMKEGKEKIKERKKKERKPLRSAKDYQQHYPFYEGAFNITHLQ